MNALPTTRAFEVKTTRTPSRKRSPVPWRKLGFAIGIPTLVFSSALLAWHFRPRDPLPPELIGTIMNRSARGTSLAFNDGLRQGQTVLLLAGDHIWAMPSGTELYQGSERASALSPDGHTLLVNGALVDWRSHNATPLESQGSQFSVLVFGNSGSLLAGAGTNGSLALLDATTGKLTRTLRAGNSSSQIDPCYIRSLAFSSDDGLVAAGGTDGFISLWNIRTGDLVTTLPENRTPCNGDSARPLRCNSVQALSFSRNGNLLASEDACGFARVWDIKANKLRFVLPFNLNLAADPKIGFSPGERFLVASTTTFGRLKETFLPNLQDPYQIYLVWDTSTGTLLRAVGFAGWGTFAFAGDSLLIAQRTRDLVQVQRWKLGTRTRLPFLTPKLRQPMRSDGKISNLFEEQAIGHLNGFQINLRKYANELHSFPESVAQMAGKISFDKEGFNPELRGYKYSYLPGSPVDGKILTYSISARPLLYQQTGSRSFRLDQTGQLRSTIDDRDTTDSDPIYSALDDNTSALEGAQSNQEIAASQPESAPAGPGPASSSSSETPITVNENRSAASVATANQWVTRAESQFQQGDYRGAIQSCDFALQADPGNARARQLKQRVEETMKILKQ